MPSSGGRGPWKNQYAHILFAVVVVAVVVFVFTRDESDRVEATTTTSGPAVVTTTETTQAPADPSGATVATLATAETGTTTTPTTTTASREPPVLNESAITFVDGLNEVKSILAQLVSDISAANEAWDNRAETGARFEDMEAALSGVIDRTRALEETTRSLPVPPGLTDSHEAPGGPLERAAALVPLAQAVLEGLRLPSPDDGSTRREALADFVAAADAFTSSIDDVIRQVEDDAEDLGLALGTSPTTTATTTPTTQPPREMSQDALSYINGLRDFKQVLADLVAEADGANRAWDNSGETGATYRETAAALNDAIERARSFHEQVRSLPAPEPVGTLGDGPIQHAARLPTLAEAMLEGLRIPAPDDGSARRAALGDFVEAAEDFATSVDNLVSYIEENANTLGLVAGG